MKTISLFNTQPDILEPPSITYALSYGAVKNADLVYSWHICDGLAREGIEIGQLIARQRKGDRAYIIFGRRVVNEIDPK